MMDYPRILFTDWNLGQFLDSMEFQSWKLNFSTVVCLRTTDLQITILWIKEVEIAKSIDELVTSRSITGQHNFPDFDMLGAMFASALKKLLNTQSNFRGRATSSKFRPILTRKTNSVHDLREFPCSRSLRSRTRTLNFVRYKFTERRCSRFRRQRGSCSIICE